MRFAFVGLVIGLSIGSVAPAAHADDGFTFGGRIQTDVRFRPVGITTGPWYAEEGLVKGVSRNQNLFKLRAGGETGRVSAMADVDFLWLGLSDPILTLSDLALRERVDPYRLKAHAAFVQVRDMFVPGLDLRVGQQVVNWGKGDQFNPTNNINANDFEDPLLFGQQLANSMLRADYSPAGTWSLSLVWVPIFKPALLPNTANLALTDLRHIPIDQDDLRRTILTNQALALNGKQYATVVSSAAAVLPETSFQNMQASLRLAWSAAEQDIALSYYYGRSDMPQPFQNNTTQVVGTAPLPCDPAHPSQCLLGSLQTTVQLHYPRMQVVGLNVAGEIPLLGFINDGAPPFGYHVELGVYFPERSTLRLINGAILGQPAGEYPYNLNGALPEVAPSTPFAKWNVGLDYTVFDRIYVNAQWIHGFVDEFGAGDFITRGFTSVRGTVTDGCYDPTRCVDEVLRNRLGDYLVIGADTKFLGDALLARIFVIYDVTGLLEESYNVATRQREQRKLSPFGSAASAVIFPELTYNAGGGLELSVGALAKLGDDLSKFGQPAAGGTDIWTRARFSY